MADNFKIIRCPACNKEMKKVFIPTAGINVDVCVDGCGGIYFDAREYNKFDEPHEDASVIFNELANKEFTKVDESVKRTCPSCGAIMAKNYSSVKREIQIDECYSCFGKFLDGGELEKIRAEYPTEEERSADFANRLYSIVGEEYELLLKSNKEWDKNKKMNFVSKLFKRLTRFATLGIVDLDR